MKQKTIWLLIVVFYFGLSSCEAIGGIFKAGVWTGIIGIVIIVALIIYLVGKKK